MSNLPCDIDTYAQNPYKTYHYCGALPETDCRGADVTADQAQLSHRYASDRRNGAESCGVPRLLSLDP
jgi:hypothetical protein